MNIVKLISVASVIAMTIGVSAVVNAEDKTKPATDQSAVAPAQQPAQTQTKMVSIAEAMQYTPAQKTAAQTIQKQQAEHDQQMKAKYRELILLSKAEKLDKKKVEEVTDAMVVMVRKFAAGSTAANHDFYISLTPDQNKRMEAIAKQLQQRQQIQQQRQQQQQQQQPDPKK